MLKQTTVYNVSLHLHAKFQKCHLKFDAVSAFSLVLGYSTFSSVLRTIVVYSCLERCPGLFSQTSFFAELWTFEILFFSFFFKQLSSGFSV